MPLFTASEIEELYQDTGGVVVSLGSDSTYGHVDNPDEALYDEASGQNVVVGTATVVRVPTGVLTGLARSERITVDGTVWEVHDFRKVMDGAETEIILAEVD